MTNKATLAILLTQLANITGNATSKAEAEQKGLDTYLHLDNYPMYGGYNLVAVAVKGGGHRDAFNSFSSCGNRMPAKQMIEKIRSFIAGVNYSK